LQQPGAARRGLRLYELPAHFCHNQIHHIHYRRSHDGHQDIARTQDLDVNVAVAGVDEHVILREHVQLVAEKAKDPLTQRCERFIA
jgi:hypothetical protein